MLSVTWNALFEKTTLLLHQLDKTIFTRLLAFLINLGLLNLSRTQLTTVLVKHSLDSFFKNSTSDKIYDLLINSTNFKSDLIYHLINYHGSKRTGLDSYLDGSDYLYFDMLSNLHTCIQSIKKTQHITPYKTQVHTAINMFEGKIVEMPTGEGKTVTILMCAYLRAMLKSNKTIYVTSVNNYLTKRDYEWSLKIWEDLGLKKKVGLIQNDHGFSDDKQLSVQEVHLHCNVVYITHSDLIFDYMNVGRVNVIPVRPKTSELIVDELDLVLIDNINSPYVISSSNSKESDYINFKNLSLLKKVHNFFHSELILDKDYQFLPEGENFLTQEGLQKMNDFLRKEQHLKERTLIFFLLDRVTWCHHNFIKNKHYVVKNGQVIVLNELTGRIEESKRFNDWFHNCLEIKEGLRCTENDSVIAHLNFQHFFNMFNFRTGVSGTITPNDREIYDCYWLSNVKAKRQFKLNRSNLGVHVLPTLNTQIDRVVKEIKHAKSIDDNPILVITPDIHVLNKLEEEVRKENLYYSRISALDEREEEKIVAIAGQPNRLTLATNIISRGTDIHIGGYYENVDARHLSRFLDIIQADQKHLRLIKVGLNKALRIDKQVEGRTGRQGRLGTIMSVNSIEDSTVVSVINDWSLFKRWRPYFNSQWKLRLLQKIQEKMDETKRWYMFKETWTSNVYFHELIKVNSCFVSLFNFNLNTLMMIRYLLRSYEESSTISYNQLTFLFLSLRKVHSTKLLEEKVRNRWVSYEILLKNYFNNLSYVSSVNSFQKFSNDHLINNSNYERELYFKELLHNVKKLAWSLMCQTHFFLPISNPF